MNKTGDVNATQRRVPTMAMRLAELPTQTHLRSVRWKQRRHIVTFVKYNYVSCLIQPAIY